MPTRVIDIHPHIIAADTGRYPLAPLGGHQSEWSRTRPVTTEQMLDSMDKAGVGKSVIVQASTCYGHDNSYVADAVAAHPDRFTGVFSVDVLAPDASDRIRYWVGRKLTGLRLFPIGSTMPDQASWLDDPKSYAAWQTAADLGIPICLQMSPKAFPEMIRMIERFPRRRSSSTTVPGRRSTTARPMGRRRACSSWPSVRTSTSSSRSAISPNRRTARRRPRPFSRSSSARSARSGSPGARTTRLPRARSPICWRSPNARSPACPRATGTGFSPRPRRRCIPRWPIEDPVMAEKITL